MFGLNLFFKQAVLQTGCEGSLTRIIGEPFAKPCKFSYDKPVRKFIVGTQFISSIGVLAHGPTEIIANSMKPA